MEAACESYKADQGTYPSPKTEYLVPPNLKYNPSAYVGASRGLYQALSGDGDDALLSGTAASTGNSAGHTQYMAFKSKMLGGLGNPDKPVYSGVYIKDPFGNAYGYYAPDLSGTSARAPVAFNPTFDLWSTGKSTNETGTNTWLKNW